MGMEGEEVHRNLQIAQQRELAYANFPTSYFGEDANDQAIGLLLAANRNQNLIVRLRKFTRHIADRYPHLSHASPGGARRDPVIKIGAQLSATKIDHMWAIFIEVRGEHAMSVHVVRRQSNPEAHAEIELPIADDGAWENVWGQQLGIGGNRETLEQFLAGANAHASNNPRGMPFFPFNRNTINQRIADAGNVPSLPKNVVLFGPPGTGKTFATTTVAVAAFAEVQANAFFDDRERQLIAACAEAIADRSFRPDDESMDDVARLYSKLVRSGRIQFVTFHQSYGYEDFVEGIRARAVSDKIEYYNRSGVFKKIAKAALEEWYRDRRGAPPGRKSIFKATHGAIVGERPADGVPAGNSPSMPYVLVIDEINRGNVAKIFGELITLIEDSKRAVLPEHRQANDGDQPTGVLLPLSGDTLYLPPNLYLIGTMNTADRSLIGMDMAMRRRFSFMELLPDAGVLDGIKLRDGDVTLDLGNFLRKLNERIVRLDCPEHQIGHAYFIRVQSIEGLQACMREKVIPQVRENVAGNFRVLQEILNFRGGNADAGSLVDGNGVPHTGRMEDLSFFCPEPGQPPMPVGVAH